MTTPHYSTTGGNIDYCPSCSTLGLFHTSNLIQTNLIRY
jgi:hypothetical protein